MYKIGDIVYLYMKTATALSIFNNIEITEDRFGKIVNIELNKETDTITYKINILNSKETIEINDVLSSFTFCEAKYLLDIIESSRRKEITDILNKF